MTTAEVVRSDGEGLVDWRDQMPSDGLVPPPGADGPRPGAHLGSDASELTFGGRFCRKVDERTLQANPRIAAMDADGVGIQVLFAPPYAVAFDGPPAETASLVTEDNELLVRVVAEAPQRFAVLAMLPLGDPWATTAELERIVTYRGVVGVCFTGLKDDALCQPEERDLCRGLAEAALGMAAQVLPSISSNGRRLLHEATPAPSARG